MLDIGEVPDDWATSIYQPTFKKGEKTNPNNYRGISLASCLYKLFTSVLTERIREDLEKRDVLGIEQAGFRNELLKSCVVVSFRSVSTDIRSLGF